MAIGSSPAAVVIDETVARHVGHELGKNSLSSRVHHFVMHSLQKTCPQLAVAGSTIESLRQMTHGEAAGGEGSGPPASTSSIATVAHGTRCGESTSQVCVCVCVYVCRPAYHPQSRPRRPWSPLWRAGS